VRLIVEEGYAPADNMARDEALFLAFDDTNEPVWRIYTWDRPAVTFGRLQSYPGDNASFSVIRRLTGGGFVPHGADLTYCVVQERRRGYDNYREIIEVLADALNSVRIDCAIWEDPERGAAGKCFASLAPFDIHVGGRKLAGCAQYRTKHAVMHHGSVANGVPAVELVDSGLWDPGSVATVEEILGKPLTGAEFAEAVEAALDSRDIETKRGGLTENETETADHLRGKYSSDMWNKKALWKP
jgi:lipoate-protein ligase A